MVTPIKVMTMMMMMPKAAHRRLPVVLAVVVALVPMGSKEEAATAAEAAVAVVAACEVGLSHCAELVAVAAVLLNRRAQFCHCAPNPPHQPRPQGWGATQAVAVSSTPRWSPPTQTLPGEVSEGGIRAP